MSQLGVQRKHFGWIIADVGRPFWKFYVPCLARRVSEEAYVCLCVQGQGHSACYCWYGSRWLWCNAWFMAVYGMPTFYYVYSFLAERPKETICDLDTRRSRGGHPAPFFSHRQKSPTRRLSWSLVRGKIGVLLEVKLECYFGIIHNFSVKDRTIWFHPHFTETFRGTRARPLNHPLPICYTSLDDGSQLSPLTSWICPCLTPGDANIRNCSNFASHLYSIDQTVDYVTTEFKQFRYQAVVQNGHSYYLNFLSHAPSPGRGGEHSLVEHTK